jgi:hypothetical protein
MGSSNGTDQTFTENGKTYKCSAKCKKIEITPACKKNINITITSDQDMNKLYPNPEKSLFCEEGQIVIYSPGTAFAQDKTKKVWTWKC